MKTCTRCGRTYPLDQTFCSACGLALPGLRGIAGAASETASVPAGSLGAGPAEPRAAQIDFLLAQLDEWVRSGWVAPEQARRLWDIYQLRRQQLFPALNLPPVPAVSPAPAVSSAPGISPAPESVPVATAPPRRKFALAAFLEARNLSLWQILGALLLLAGLAGLIGWTWGTVGRYLVLALMLGLTSGLPALARSRFVRSEPLTRSSFLAVAALLVPLDVVAVNAFRLLGGALGTAEIGLAASGVSLPLYGWLARREPGRWPAALLAAALGFALYFALRVLPPGGLSPEARSLVYGMAFAGLTLGFFLAARRADTARREVWRGAAQVASLSALALALWLGGPGTVSPAAVPLLLLGVVYAVAAALLNDKSFVFIAQAALTVGGLLTLRRWESRGVWESWYIDIVWVQAVGLVSLAGDWRLRSTGRADAARACVDGSLVLAVLALTAQAVRLAWDFAASPALSLPASEVAGLLAAATLSFGYFIWTRRGTLAASLGVYLVALIYWLGTRLLWHGPVNFALPLAASAVALWMLRRPADFAKVSLAAVSLSLLLCADTSAAGLPALWLTTVLALPIIVWAFALLERSGEAASIWPLLGAAILEALLLESRLLPWASTHWGWEANYGFGLVPLSLLALAFSERRSRVWLWAGLLVTAGNVLLQLGYAISGSLDYSSLALLALGAALAVGVAFARPVSRAADCAMLLLAAFCGAFLLGLLGGHTAGRETAAAVVLLLFSPLTAWLAFWVRRPALVYCAALSGALGLLHGLHRWHPAAAIYAEAIWPYAAVLFGAALWAERQRSARWSAVLGNSAAIISMCVLLGAASATLLGSAAGSAAWMTLLAVLCGYGALYAAFGTARQSQPLASLAALTLSGAFWLALVQAAPHLSGPRLGFALSLGGFAWLAGAAGAERVTTARFAVRVLNFAAIGIGLAAILVALVSLNGTDNRFAVYVLLVAGSVFLGASRGLSLPGWGQVGVAAYFVAYFAFLEKRLGAPGVASSDFYLIPAGLYVLALGLLSRRRAEVGTPVYFLTGLLLVLTPTFAAAWPVSAPPLHAVLLLFEGVGAVFYGIAARIKLFAGVGAAFLLALLLRELQGFAGHIHWAVYATGLGLLILASALYFEKRGDAVQGWAQAAREKLSDWD